MREANFDFMMFFFCSVNQNKSEEINAKMSINTYSDTTFEANVFFSGTCPKQYEMPIRRTHASKLREANPRHSQTLTQTMPVV